MASLPADYAFSIPYAIINSKKKLAYKKEAIVDLKAFCYLLNELYAW